MAFLVGMTMNAPVVWVSPIAGGPVNPHPDAGGPHPSDAYGDMAVINHPNVSPVPMGTVMPLLVLIRPCMAVVCSGTVTVMSFSGSRSKTSDRNSQSQ